MDRRLRARLSIVTVIAIIAAAAGVFWYRTRPIDLAGRLQRLPTANSVVLYVDFAQLRQAGLLGLITGSKTAQDPDYRKFIADSGFDYERDLDSALVAFAPNGNYMLVSGRFDWERLNRYAQAQGGACVGSTCEMPGSTPQRKISFVPLRQSLMALAVSPDSLAVNRIARPSPGAGLQVSKAPVWLALNGTVLRSGNELPAGTRMFARSMQDAQSVRLELAPDGGRLAARLDIQCRDEGDAARISAELTRLTGMLRGMIEREKQTPNTGDLSGVLTSGTFHTEGTRVLGHWPIERAFIENLLNGGVG